MQSIKILLIELLKDICLIETKLKTVLFYYKHTKSFECLGDDKDVVNADAEEEEGDDGVGGRVEEPNQGAEPVGQDHAHRHAQDAHHRQPNPLE